MKKYYYILVCFSLLGLSIVSGMNSWYCSYTNSSTLVAQASESSVSTGGIVSRFESITSSAINTIPNSVTDGAITSADLDTKDFDTGYIENRKDPASVRLLKEEEIASLKKVKISINRKTLYVNGTIHKTAKLKTSFPFKLKVLIAKKKAKVKLYSKNPDIATITQKGTVRAKKAGKATLGVSIELSNGSYRILHKRVTVKNASIQWKSLKKTLTVGSHYQYKVKVYGYKLSQVRWSTTAAKILSVHQKSGKAVAKTVGHDLLIVKAKYYRLSAIIRIKKAKPAKKTKSVKKAKSTKK